MVKGRTFVSATATWDGCFEYALSASSDSKVESSIRSAVEEGRRPVAFTLMSTRPGIFPLRPSRPSLMPCFTEAFSESDISFSVHKIMCFTIFVSFEIILA